MLRVIADQIALGTTDPVRSFQDALNRLKKPPHNADLSCSSPLDCPALDATDRYITVMRIEKFISQYAGASHSYTLSADSIREVEDRYFSGAEKELGDITIVSKVDPIVKTNFRLQ